MRFAVQWALLQQLRRLRVDALGEFLGGCVVAALELRAGEPAEGFEVLRRDALRGAVGTQYLNRTRIGAAGEGGPHILHDASRHRYRYKQHKRNEQQPESHAGYNFKCFRYSRKASPRS